MNVRTGQAPGTRATRQVPRAARASTAATCGGTAFALILALTAAMTAGAAVPAVLRVCADPNNLPFTNDRGEGFENRLAAMLAADSAARLEYVWWPQRRGFIRHTLDAGRCEVVMGMPAGTPQVRTTRPYYRSTYVFVSPRGKYRGLTLDDPRLRTLRVGVQMIGDDFANTPPAHALSAHGITRNVVGYSVLGDYSRPNPPARIVEAVARGEIDTALVWGPLAGYFARRSTVPLDVIPATPQPSNALPFTFDIAIAVRRDDDARRQAIDEFLERRRQDIDALLAKYGVPRVDRRGGPS